MTAKRVLRDLPGVAELEARLTRIANHKSPLWTPDGDYLHEDVDRLSRELFGLTESDTYFDEDVEAAGLSEDLVEEAWDRWEAHFAVLGEENEHFFLRKPASNSLVAWEAMGWDVSDGGGREMWATALLGRQIVALAKGLRKPGHSLQRALTDDETQEIEARLTAEAAKFRPKR